MGTTLPSAPSRSASVIALLSLLSFLAVDSFTVTTTTTTSARSSSSRSPIFPPSAPRTHPPNRRIPRSCTPPPAMTASSGTGTGTGGRTADVVADATASATKGLDLPDDARMKEALASLSKDDSTKGHIYGQGDPSHELSMLQKITATRILDYEALMADPKSPTPEELMSQIKSTEDELGPRLNLLDVVQSKSPSMALAAEFKRSSPSKGDIAVDLDAGEQTARYAAAGASVISVLTEPHWFKGTLDDLRDARVETQKATNKGMRPAILRKEFTTNTYQILEAASVGADTILLIVAVLPSDLLKELIDFCRSIGMEPLVEVHTDKELDVALNAGARVIGVNNRNLHTFKMDLATTDRAAGVLAGRGLRFDHSSVVGDEEKRPPYVLCALSGMSSAEDVDRYRRVGVGMVLIGESLMRAADPGAAIGGLCLDPDDYDSMVASSSGGAYTAGNRLVKVCGITNPDDALAACRAGASLIGVIFAERSKRRVTRERARSIVSAVREFGERDSRVSIPELGPPPGGSVDDAAKAPPPSPLSALVRKSRALENACRPRPLVVGVFQNSPSGEVRSVADDVGLDLVQLHGDEGMEACADCGVPAIRVVDVEAGQAAGGDAAEGIIAALTSDPAAILLDTAVKGAQGGTGVTFDWGVAEALQDRGLPVIVAGGLNADNVKDIVTDVRPWGVDVSSGVEAKPGQKDVDKVTAFVSGAQKAAEEAAKGF